MADDLGDAIHGAATAVMEASKSLKKICAGVQNFAVTEKNGQDQGHDF